MQKIIAACFLFLLLIAISCTLTTKEERMFREKFGFHPQELEGKPIAAFIERTKRCMHRSYYFMTDKKTKEIVLEYAYYDKFFVQIYADEFQSYPQKFGAPPEEAIRTFTIKRIRTYQENS